eukprot:4296420-Amphidinium_carterae.1
MRVYVCVPLCAKASAAALRTEELGWKARLGHVATAKPSAATVFDADLGEWNHVPHSEQEESDEVVSTRSHPPFAQ